MIVVGSCYFLFTLLIPYDPNIDFVFPLISPMIASVTLSLRMGLANENHRYIMVPDCKESGK